MAYFPFFVDLSGADGLIVGGGAVALRKIEKLLPYDPRLTVCAKAFLPEVEAVPGLTLVRGPFTPDLLAGKLFVVAATDDNALNMEIAAQCRQKHIPVNVVDDKEKCTFLFPALVKRGPLSIGISTGGSSPSGAVHWKREIDRLIPQDAGDMLDYLDGLRGTVKEAVPDGMARAAVFSILFDACLKNGWPLSDRWLDGLLGGLKLSGLKEELP